MRKEFPGFKIRISWTPKKRGPRNPEPAKKGRPPIDKDGNTVHIGFRASTPQKNEILSVAKELGFKTSSDLIRRIVEGWLSTYRKTKGLREAGEKRSFENKLKKEKK